MALPDTLNVLNIGLTQTRLSSHRTQTPANVCIFGHMTKMAVIPFDPPYPKTLCCTQTSRLYLLLNRNYCQLKFCIVWNRNFRFFSAESLTLTRDLHIRTWPVSSENVLADQNELYTSRLSKVIVLHTRTMLNGRTSKCVRLSRPLVGFRTHFKSQHFHFISFHYNTYVQTDRQIDATETITTPLHGW